MRQGLLEQRIPKKSVFKSQLRVIKGVRLIKKQLLESTPAKNKTIKNAIKKAKANLVNITLKCKQVTLKARKRAATINNKITSIKAKVADLKSP